jgi:hypothetical protein
MVFSSSLIFLAAAILSGIGISKTVFTTIQKRFHHGSTEATELKGVTIGCRRFGSQVQEISVPSVLPW